MTRKECERKLAAQIQELWKTYREYNPDGKYLSVACIGDDYRDCNNQYFSDDEDKPINFHGSLTNMRRIRFEAEKV